MGVHILRNEANNTAVMYCSTSMWAFGPVFESSQQAQAFLKWLSVDPRGLDDPAMERKYLDFLTLTDQQKHDAGLCETLEIHDCKLCASEPFDSRFASFVKRKLV